MQFLRKITWPISLVYGLAVHVRNLLYDHHVFKSKSFDTPTICVGNLSVGGTGKTPMIEFLISRFQDKYQLAVLSRGYKRKSKGFQLGSKNSSVEQLGDEPFQIQMKYPKIIVAVDADRQNGISTLKKTTDPDLVLLDDAFQHRKVSPTFSILLTTFSDPYFNDWYLPTGNLRDSKSASLRADAIVVTKCPSKMSKEKMGFFKKQLNTPADQMVLFATLTYDHTLYGNGAKLKLKDLRGKRFTLVTGIANPTPLIQYLEERDLAFEHLKFADHHSFSRSEIELLKKKPLVLTTEKDFVRLQNKVEHLYYIRVAHQFIGNGEVQLMEAIADNIRPYC